MPDYIKTIRAKTGHMPLILNAAGGIVINARREVLLQERADGGWCVPGGYLEFGETYREAVLREMQEDAGLEVEIIADLGLFDNHYYMHYPNGDLVMNIAKCFLVRPVGGSLAAAAPWETKQLKYFPLDELPPIIFQQNEDMVVKAHALLTAGKI
ncbi:NUDIX hydrolase [Lacticaseibacillus sharpeae]|uniref:ADP-ribose pyrophosphatase n=1 Tax=Lacticaseibacillus sharpeae JCM 1186 = DSM 20505 TaxID=1291052 RepID=A0A0R1ZHK0_9LACO|nr:NUDIX domain-containing protein [Lacticaseibacillus sharpeae]KRM54385.1 ADP-ribose pyrophosphatase [Lacticaseibacillus sharpeae JCM 1186 = DSM 20505]